MRSLLATSIVWFVIAAVAVPFAHSSEPWHSQGPSGTNFHSLTQAPDGSILAGTVSGLLRFDDPSRGWRPVPLDYPGVGLVFASSDGFIFAQTYSSGCIAAFGHWVSVDNGETWSDDDGLPNWSPIVSLAETSDGTLWAGGRDGFLYRRTPGASGWTQDPPITPMGTLFDLAVTTDGSLLVLASDSETGDSLVFHSEDNGENWSIPLRTATHLSKLAIGPLDLAVVGGRVESPDNVTFFSSTNSGRAWSERPCTSDACSDLISLDGLVVLADRRVAATGRSTNRVSSALIVSDLFMDRWSPAASFSEPPSTLLTDRAGAFWVAGIGYAWRSNDNAASFEPVSDGVVKTTVSSLASTEGHIFAVVGTYGMGGYSGVWNVPGTAGVHVSADDGATWTATPVWQANQITGSHFAGVLAATDLGVLRSVDHGTTWETISVTDRAAVQAAAENRYGTLCVISGLELRCAQNDALDWHGTQEIIQSDDVLIVVPDGTFLGEISGIVHRSTDGGQSWIPTPLEGDVSQMAVGLDGAVYALASGSRTIAVSTDSGVTWDFKTGPSDYSSSMAFHRVAGVLVGGHLGIAASNDGLETWTGLGIGGNLLLVTGDRLVVGRDRDGIWLADLPASIRRPTGRSGGR